MNKNVKPLQMPGVNFLTGTNAGSIDNPADGDFSVGGSNVSADATTTYVVDDQTWTVGVDYDGDGSNRPFKIARTSALGTDDLLSFTGATGQDITINGNITSVGDITGDGTSLTISNSNDITLDSSGSNLDLISGDITVDGSASLAFDGGNLMVRNSSTTFTNPVSLPSYTSYTRPTGSAGMVVYNTTTSALECHDGTNWRDMASAIISELVTAPMTAFNVPSPQVLTGSSEYTGGTRLFHHAFNGTPSTQSPTGTTAGWRSVGGSFSASVPQFTYTFADETSLACEYVKLDLGRTIKLTDYKIWSRSYVSDTTSYVPTEWKIKVSVDDSTFSDIDTQAGQTFTMGVAASYSVTPVDARYIYYIALACTQTSLIMGEIEYFGYEI